MLTISEDTLNKFSLKGFIFCGDSVILTEDASEQDRILLKSFGYTLLN